MKKYQFTPCGNYRLEANHEGNEPVFLVQKALKWPGIGTFWHTVLLYYSEAQALVALSNHAELT